MGKSRRRVRPADWPDWYVPKTYPHFDRPLRSPEDVKHIVESPDQCAKRAFLPFIRFERIARKYKRAEKRFVKKPRDLKYASHTDSQILRYYANILGAAYEQVLSRDGLGDSVLAYRKFAEPKCNIHFANEAFQWIESHTPCTAIAFDVKDFFESLDHSQLKSRWREVLGSPSLPPDHYNVFKQITRYAWVDRDEVFRLFGITKKKLKDWQQPICTPEQFRKLVRDADPVSLVKRKADNCGIPQGSPISALLSNVYMLDVDRRMVAFMRQVEGRYMRYSDDILLLVPSERRGAAEAELFNAMNDAKLQLHDGPGKRSTCIVSRTEAHTRACKPPLQYLGFTYDGSVVRIRSQTVAKFLRRMRKAVRREKYLASKAAERGESGQVRRKMLYSTYSHLGTRNFITGYAADAKAVFAKHAIRAQLKSHWRDLHAELSVE